MAVEVGDVVRLNYTARTSHDRVVDTTYPEVAEEARVDDVGGDGAVAVVVGEGHVFPPLEDALLGAEPGDSGEVRVPPSKAFGARDPGRVEEVEVEALPESARVSGARVDVGGDVGHVDQVEDGVAVVDFNHPLAGQELTYEYEVKEVVEDDADRARALAETFALTVHGAEVDVVDGAVEVEREPTSPDSDWDDARRGYVETVLEHTDLDSVELHETYV
ncbi:MAG: peptidylprolyl isomerase [Halobacteriales archaeon]